MLRIVGEGEGSEASTRFTWLATHCPASGLSGQRHAAEEAASSSLLGDRRGGGLVVFHCFPTGAALSCRRAAECQELGEESRSRNCNKGLLVGALEERRVIPVSELLGRGKKVSLIEGRGQAGE